MSYNAINPYQTFYDTAGNVRAAGTATFYTNGTTTKASIYSDESLSTAQNNPYTLDANGRIAADVKFNGLLTLQLANFDGSDVVTTDNVSSLRSSVSNEADMAGLVAATQQGVVTLKGFHSAGDGGGGSFYWDSTQNQANHNGGTIIDPDNAADLGTWDASAKTTWFTVGSGTGCWMRIFSEPFNVQWFGATGDSATDDWAAIQAVIDSGEKTIYLPGGGYSIESTLTLVGNEQQLVGDGPNATTIINSNSTLTDDCILFQATDPTVNNVWANTNGISNMRIRSKTGSLADRTAGAAIKMVKQSGFHLFNCRILDHPLGVSMHGCKTATVKDVELFGTNITYSATGSLLGIHEYINGDATVQVAWTSTYDNIYMGCEANTGFGIHVTSGDGLSFSNMYIANAKLRNMILENPVSGSFIASVQILSTYFDGINPTTGTTTGIELNAQTADGSISEVSIVGCFLGGYQSYGVLITGERVGSINIESTHIKNNRFAGVRVDDDCSVLRLILSGTAFVNSAHSGFGAVTLDVVKCDTLNVVGCMFQQNSVVASTYPILQPGGGSANSVTITGNSFIKYTNVPTMAGTVTDFSYVGNVDDITGAEVGFELVSAANVITASENGTTFYLSNAGGFTSTLPAPQIGLKYTFIVRIAPTTAYIIGTNSGDNVLYGTFLDIVGELTYFTIKDTITFVASTSLKGDRLEVESDGTSWYCKAFSGADGGITTSAS